MSTNEDLRRSKRTTAGVLPIRYRDGVSPVDDRSPENTSSLVHASSRIGSRYSQRRGPTSVSSRTSMSSRTRREAEAARDKELLALKKELSSLKKKVRSAEVYLSSKEKRLESMQKMLDNGEGHGSELNNKLTELQEEVWSLEEALNIAKIDLQEFEENNEQAVQAINSRFNVDADDSDGQSQYFTEEEDFPPDVNNWLDANEAVADANDTVSTNTTNNAQVSSATQPGPNVVAARMPIVNVSPPATSAVAVPTTEPLAQATSHILIEFMKSQLENSKLNESRFKSHADRRLPAFNGDPAKWNIFQDAYQRSTKKYNYDDAENVRRLQECLFGDAERAVRHLLANPRNVPEILNVLQSRFGRPVLVIDHCIKEVQRCPKLDLANMESLDNFGVRLNSLVANICSFDMNEYLMNRTLLKELVTKLPRPWAQLWYEKEIEFENQVPNIQDFRDWLNKKIEAARRLELEIEVKPVQQEGNWRRRQPGHLNNINGAAKSPAKPKGRPLCPCCQRSGHELAACFKFQKEDVDSRWKIVREAKVCFSCLKKERHTVSSCPLKKDCGINGCSSKHHQLLHADTRKENNHPEPTDEHGHVGFIKGCDGPLPIIPVKLKGPKGVKQVYALLDTGATRSLISSDVADFVGLTGDRISYKYSGISGVTMEEKDACQVSCEVSGTHKYAAYFPLENAVTVSNIPIPPYSFELDKAKQQWPHLRCIQGSNLREVVPSLVIGNNNPLLILANRIVSGPEKAPVGWRTRLGWTVSGSFDKCQAEGRFNFTYLRGEDDRLHDLIKSSFSTENFGVRIPASKGVNVEEKRAYAILNETTRRIGAKWETGLLWKSDNVSMPDSYAVAFKRLQYVEKKMSDLTFAKLYQEKIDDYLQRGYIRKLSYAECQMSSDKKLFIPHFGVTNPNKPGKLRLVFDAAAKCNGTSLNDELLTGPDLMRSLTSILWNFRSKPVVITGDIENMFPSIGIRKDDRMAQRILWRNGDLSVKPSQYEVSVMMPGAKCSPASAIFTLIRNAEEFDDQYPAAVLAIKEDTYMDDCLTGACTVEEAIKLREDISTIMSAGGFSIKKWTSNSSSVIASIPPDLIDEGFKNLEEKGELPTSRLLGLYWEPKSDCLTFRLNLHKVKEDVLHGRRPTKREICSVIMSVYDPLGIIANFRIKGMIILQLTWKCGIGWDDEVPQNINMEWQKWLGMLPNIEQVQLPRCYSLEMSHANFIELHTFVDASAEAFAAVSYLRLGIGDSFQVTFLGAKVRVAPLKKLTIPRLELQAAVLGARFALAISEELRCNIAKKVFWSDSSTVLAWIRSTGAKLPEFVANRVGEIREISDSCQWRWVPTKENVADQATRMSSEIVFTSDSTWFTGPTFLRLPTEQFPEEKKRTESSVVCVLSNSCQSRSSEENSCNSCSNVKSCDSCLTNGNSCESRSTNKNSCDSRSSDIPTPPIEYFSSFARLLKATAAVSRAAKFWIQKTRCRQEKSALPMPPWKVSLVKKKAVFSTLEPYSSAELENAELTLIRKVHAEVYPEELRDLQNGNQVRKSSHIFKLSPSLKNGLITMRGRLGAADHLPPESRHPIILPAYHHFTALVILKEHAACAHQSQGTVLTNLRRKFWIVSGQHTVRRVASSCGLCHLRRVKPICPEMGQLPFYRVQPGNPPFTFTGLDFFGPIEVTVGRRHEKRWGAIFTCMATRAVHLEVAANLSSDEAIMAISRFADTRGRPRTIICDNGTNFRGASRLLKEEYAKLDVKSIQAHGKFSSIEFRFIPAASPHFGGVYERMVQSVKKCLTSLLREKFPRDTTLLTALKSAENIVNSRPLTAISSDPADPEALTPNHFLRGSCDVGPTIPAEVARRDATAREQWKRAQAITEEFWKRWILEYLPKLNKRDKWFVQQESLEVGDLVFLENDQAPRNTWERGYVSSIFPGPDGVVRAVDVVTCRDRIPKRRSVARVCPLGIRMVTAEATLPQLGAGKCRGDTPEREQRKAAKCASPQLQDATGRQVRKNGTATHLRKQKQEKCKLDRSTRKNSASVSDEEDDSDDYEF